MSIISELWNKNAAGNDRLSDQYLFGGFSRKKGGRLSGLLEREYLPELERSRDTRSRVEDSFYGTLDPRAGERYVTEGAQRIQADLFRPGGVIPQNIARVRGESNAQGWGTQSGTLERQVGQQISDAFSSTLDAYLGQALPAMYEGSAGRAAAAYAMTQEQVQQLLNNLYTGLGGAESLRLAGSQPRGLLGLGTPIL